MKLNYIDLYQMNKPQWHDNKIAWYDDNILWYDKIIFDMLWYQVDNKIKWQWNVMRLYKCDK